MPVPKTARGTEAKARRVRAHFKRAGFSCGPIYGPDPDDVEEDEWKFWVYAEHGKPGYDVDSALGEIHVTPSGVRSESPLSSERVRLLDQYLFGK